MQVSLGCTKFAIDMLCARSLYLQVLVEPGDSLSKGLLLGPLLLGVLQIGAHSEAVTDAAE
jgi:hypothetical protein